MSEPDVPAGGTVPKAGVLVFMQWRSELRDNMRSLLSAMMSPAALGSCCRDLTAIDSVLEVRARINPSVLKLLLSECSITDKDRHQDPCQQGFQDVPSFTLTAFLTHNNLNNLQYN